MPGSPPPYVPIVLSGEIRLEAIKKDFAKTLIARGLPLKHGFLGGWTIPFADQGLPDEDNPELVALMLGLAEAGVKFGEDYKQGCSPADFLRSLQERGVLQSKFESISWEGPDQWQLKSWPAKKV